MGWDRRPLLGFRPDSFQAFHLIGGRIAGALRFADAGRPQVLDQNRRRHLGGSKGESEAPIRAVRASDLFARIPNLIPLFIINSFIVKRSAAGAVAVLPDPIELGISLLHSPPHPLERSSGKMFESGLLVQSHLFQQSFRLLSYRVTERTILRTNRRDGDRHY
jgi:hypothetical protein